MRHRTDLDRRGAASRDLRERRGELIAEIMRAQVRVCATEAAQVELLGRLLQDGLDESRRQNVDLYWGVQEAATEAAVALDLSERVTTRLMELGHRLRGELPCTLEAWREGRLTRRHVEVIEHESVGLSGDELRRFEDELLHVAAGGATPARLRRRAQRLRELRDPEARADRHEAALAERRVAVDAAPNGMAWLSVLLSAVDARAGADRVRQIARQVRDAEFAQRRDPLRSGLQRHDQAEVSEPRTLTQLQADVLHDLLVEGEVPTARTPLGRGVRARVVVTVPVDAVLGDDSLPAELAGHGPIDARTARRLAARAAGLERLLIDPDTGVAIGLGRRVYRPTADLRRLIRTRDGTCRFPGCQRLAEHCEIDHTINWEWGGRTDPDNLACLCRRHHMMKHQTEWVVRQRGGGVLEWVSPTGTTYCTEPEAILSR
jgi:hypothetical protein